MTASQKTDLKVSEVQHAIRHLKLRLFGHGSVANPHDTSGIAAVCASP